MAVPSTFHARRARPPRRTLRRRLTLTYFGLFLASGAALLALTFLVWYGTTTHFTAPVNSQGQSATNATSSTVAQSAAGGTARQHSRDVQELLVVAVIALAVMAGASVALGWLVAGRFLRPLRTITTAAKDISAANLHERLNLGGPDDELKELGDTFDGLLGRLERSFQLEHQFVANASHELRTPNATMRVWLDVAMAKPEPVPPHIAALSERLHHELDHVDRLLDGLLALAQAQCDSLETNTTVSLAALSSATIAARTEAITHKQLDISQDTSIDLPVTGNEILLRRMVDNVIDNAIKHNAPGGWIRVKTTATGGAFAQLIVENGGPLLAQDDVTDLDRPFRRLGAQRTGSVTGSGLGLSIVKSVAEVHGGTLALHARTEGGLRVVIALPAVAKTVAGAQP